jgi:predicted transcriptional regulator
MLSKDKALEHDTRRMIYQHIIAHPGVSYLVLKNVFNLSDGTLRYHLNYLVKAEKIKFGLEKGKRLYYPHPDDEASREVFSSSIKNMNLNDTQEKLLITIKHYPGITQKELIQITKLKRFTIVNNINRLLKLNLIQKINSTKSVCYEYIPDEILRYEMLKNLVIKLIKKEIDVKTFLELKRRLEKP